MNPAAGTDRHGGGPLPAERFEITLIRMAKDAGAAVRALPLPLSGALHLGKPVQRIVDLLVRLAGHNGNRPGNAVSRRPFVPGRRASAVVEDKLHLRIPFVLGW